MTTKRYGIYRFLGCIILLLMFCTSFPNALYAQGQYPYQLSEAVQVRAKELNIWKQIIENKLGNPVTIYLNELTAVDIMAKRRAEFQGNRGVLNSDYDMMFASWCRFIPNKPPLKNFSKISETVRKEILESLLYLDDSRRLKLQEAMHSVLLEGKITDLYSILEKINSIENFNKEVFDSGVFVK